MVAVGGNDPPALRLSSECSTTELHGYKYVVFKHLISRNTRYLPHFTFAFGAGVVLLLAGLASIVHAILPNLFTGYSERKTRALARLSRIRNGK